MEDKATPLYTAVLFTEVPTGLRVTASDWEKNLQTLALLAEAAPGYEGYHVESGSNGQEYAVTYWRDAQAMKNWKACAALLLDPFPWLSKLYGPERCLWPWMDQQAHKIRFAKSDPRVA